jgi:hypothetical protein
MNAPDAQPGLQVLPAHPQTITACGAAILARRGFLAGIA